MEQLQEFKTSASFKKLTPEELLLDTKGACFLCLKEILNEQSSSDNISNCYDNCITEVSLKKICRYLKIDTGEILLRNLSEGQVKKDKCNYSVTLCPSCSSQARKLTDLIDQLERVRMLLNYQFQEFNKILIGVDKEEESAQWDRVRRKMVAEGTNCAEIGLVEDLRQLTKQKVERIRTTSSPRVVLESLSNIHKGPSADKDRQRLHDTDINSHRFFNSSEDSTQQLAIKDVHDKALNVNKTTPPLNSLVLVEPVIPVKEEPVVDNSVAMDNRRLHDATSVFSQLRPPEFSTLPPELVQIPVISNNTQPEEPWRPSILKRRKIPETPTSNQIASKIWICDTNDQRRGRNFPIKFSLPPPKQVFLPGVPGGKTLPTPELKRGKKMFVCSEEDGGCGKEFTKRYNMEFHKRHHCPLGDARDSWKCDQLEGGCGKGFSSQHVLLRHKENSCEGRREKKDFQCQKEEGGCGGFYSSKVGLERHQMKFCPKRRAEDVWICDLGDEQCGTKCSSEAGLIRHQNFMCPFRIGDSGGGGSGGGTDLLGEPSTPEMEEALTDPLEIPSQAPQVSYGAADTVSFLHHSVEVGQVPEKVELDPDYEGGHHEVGNFQPMDCDWDYLNKIM